MKKAVTSAADVTAPVSAALGVVDDATAPDVRSDDAVPTGRTRRHNAGKHRNTARLHAAAKLVQQKKRLTSVYDEIRAIEAAAGHHDALSSPLLVSP